MALVDAFPAEHWMALLQQLAGTTGHQQRGTDFGQVRCDVRAHPGINITCTESTSSRSRQNCACRPTMCIARPHRALKEDPDGHTYLLVQTSRRIDILELCCLRLFRLQHLADHSQAPHPSAQDAREPSIDWARVLRPSERLRASSWGDSLVNAGGEDQGSKQQRFSILVGDGKMESATADKLRRQGSASSLVQTQSYESPPGDWWVALRVSFQNAALHCSMGCCLLLLPWCCVALRCVALVCTLRYDIVIIEQNSRESIHTASTCKYGRFCMRMRVLRGHHLDWASGTCSC
ncbi:hypothetical protein HDV57DRAFT_486827, partial [Trichoderma longibrachiatum]